MKRLQMLLENLKKLARSGFFPVFLSNVIAKACALLGSIVLVRILPKADYGLYTGVMNSFTMLFLMNDFGCNVAMMQFRSENHRDERLMDAYFSEPLRYGLIFSSISSLLIFFSPLFYPFKQAEIAQMTRQLCALPLLQTLNAFVISNLRVLLENKRFSIVNFSQTFFQYLFLILSASFFGVRGAVLSNYAINLATLAVGLLLSGKRFHVDLRSHALSIKQKKEFLKYALVSQFNNSIGALLNLFDVFLIGIIIINNEILSSYKVASTIPQALMFIPNSILVFAIPYFARNLRDSQWVRSNTSKLLLGCITINGAITLLGILLSPLLLPIVFGNTYADSVPVFNILMVSFFFTGSFHIPAANVIYTQHHVKTNLVITLISNAANCVFDVVLIRGYGSIGAAYATCLVSIIASMTALVCLWNIVYRERQHD